MMKVVLDTNVIVSALMTSSGNPARILTLLFDEEIQIYYCSDILIEYEDVLARPSLKINFEKIVRLFEIIKKMGTLFVSRTSDTILPDESDRVFYDTARENNAILITGNIKHYPADDFIMTPRQFLEKYFRL